MFCILDSENIYLVVSIKRLNIWCSLTSAWSKVTGINNHRSKPYVLLFNMTWRAGTNGSLYKFLFHFMGAVLLWEALLQVIARAGFFEYTNDINPITTACLRVFKDRRGHICSPLRNLVWVRVPNLFGNDLSGSYLPYSRGFMKFWWPEPCQKNDWL